MLTREINDYFLGGRLGNIVHAVATRNFILPGASILLSSERKDSTRVPCRGLRAQIFVTACRARWGACD